MIRLNRFRASWLLLAALLWLLPPAPGMAADPGERLWDKNLVYNSSFEEGEDRPTGWTQRRAFSFGQTIVPAQMSIDREVSRTGKQSFHISSPDGTTAWHSMESKPVPVEPGKHYKVAGWIKTENVHAVGSQPLHCNLHIRFTNAKGASVAVGGSRVVWTRTIDGTKDWTAVERIVTAPEGAVEARAGCVLTCSGKAWFDDVTLHAQVPIPWNKKETERITFLYEGAGAPTEEKVASTLEHLAKIETALGVKHEEKIEFYSYPSNERKQEVTGNPADTHYSGNAVHAVRWDDQHKLAHVVLRKMGESTLLVREGLAVYLSQDNLDVDLRSYSRVQSQRGLLPSIMKLIEDAEFQKMGVDVTFPAAGSFIRYLVEEYGMDKVKLLYSQLRPGDPGLKFRKVFNQIFAQRVEEVDVLWQTNSTAQ